MTENLLDNKRDDSKDPIVIDYYDRINKRWVKVETTKEVARLLKAENQRTRRKQNQYDFYNLPFDEVFDNTKKDYKNKEEYLIDENAEINLEKLDDERMLFANEEHNRALIENSLYCLTPEQRDVVELAFYENKSYSEIAQQLGISKTSVCDRMKRARQNIKFHITNTQN